jgi:hypothetical protein
MKIYRIWNRITGERWQGEAGSAQEACDKAGWLIGNCWVREHTQAQLDFTRDSGYPGAGWKTVKT